MVVGERFSLDVWEVDGWQRDLARLNEVFNVMMETSALVYHFIQFPLNRASRMRPQS